MFLRPQFKNVQISSTLFMIMSTEVSSFSSGSENTLLFCLITSSSLPCQQMVILILLILTVVLNVLSHFLTCKPCFILSTLILKFYVTPPNPI